MYPAERPEKSLHDYWRVLLRRKWIVVLGVLAAVVPAAVMSLMQDPVYEASATMLVRSLPGDNLFGTSYLGYIDPDRVVANEIQVLQSQTVYQRLKQDLGLTTNPPGVRGSGVGSTDLISASVRSGDPTTAQVLATAYVNAYIGQKRTEIIDGLVAAGEELQTKISELQLRIDDLNAKLEAAPEAETSLIEQGRQLLVSQQGLFKQKLDQLQVDTALNSGTAQLVQSAAKPTAPIEPKPRRTIMLAFMVGLLLGIGAAFLVDFLDDSIRTPEDLADVAGKRPVLAVVPVDPPPDNRPISISRPDDLAVEAYRTLRTNVQFLGFEGTMRSIQITSSVPGEGKTTTATNLAVVLAQAGNRVVLVDADLRRPRVHEVFGLDGSNGLTTALVGDAAPLKIHRIAEYLSVIVSGAAPPNPSEMLSGKRMAQIMEALNRQFDFVIIDSAPVLPVSDAVALSRQVDGVLVVAQSGRTSLPQLRQTLASLEQVSAPVLGMVLNKASSGNGGYGHGYGYGYRYTRPSTEGTKAPSAKVDAR